MILRRAISFLFFAYISFCYAQVPTQNIRGKISDKDLKQPLPGASVVLVSDTSNFTGTTTDINGNFKIENVSIGRHAIKVSYMGYQPRTVSDIIVNSGKEVILNIDLEESVVAMKEVEIVATKKGETINEMSTVSARAFTVEETDKYAGSRGDPARMASNFAGVQGADDSRNDIIIRGNSPMGVLWRVEGVNIPNPNHFAISGSAGGPIGVINNKTLANSDFMTGAFPAEYGNSIAGVFDLKFRNGNNEKHEFSGQFGLFGTEIMAEGPINKEKRSSYLLAYRYSTLSIFSFLGLDLGTSAVPRYQDINFKLNFPQKNGANLSVFGLAGKSDIEILISNQKKPEKEIYGEQDRDQYFGTAMGTVGASYTKSLNQTTYMKFTMAASLEEQHSHHDLVFRHVNADGFFKVDSFLAKQDYRFLQQKTSAYFFVNKKLNVKHHIKTGLDADMFFMNFEDSARLGYTTIFHQRWNYNGNALLLQPYIQWKYKISDNLVLNTGLHSQYFTLNNSYSLIEPRLGLKWQFEETQTLSFGTGLHSQIQPTYTYFYQIPDFFGNYQMINQQMGMTKSMHYVIGYDKFFGQNLRFKAETYYQHLFDVPVEKRNSSFSMVNQGSGFSRLFPDSLQNTGTADNYGIEFTLEKFFSRKYFFMLTTSFYESNYKGSDGVLRNTDFNGRYIVNFLFSREFKIGNNKTLALGTKITRAGNKWYSPVDTSATKLADEIIYVDSMRNTIQFKDYFRVDLKINYRINTNRLTHEIGLDLVNILSTQNVLKLSYVPDPANPSANPVREEYQLGFLPIFYYKIDF